MNMRFLVRISAFLIVLTSLSGCGVNSIPSYDEQVSATWSQVMNQYQRRAELIPNLVNVVKGYAKHEREVLTAVVEARSAVSKVELPKDILSNPGAFKQFQAAQGELSSALSRLLVTVERYPDLKASTNFQQLQSQLEGTENRIAVARRDYIEAVKMLNTELRTIPGRWWHQFLYADVEAKETFSVSEELQQVPTVNF